MSRGVGDNVMNIHIYSRGFITASILIKFYSPKKSCFDIALNNIMVFTLLTPMEFSKCAGLDKKKKFGVQL